MEYDNGEKGKVIDSSVLDLNSEWGDCRAVATYWKGAGSAARISRAGERTGCPGGWAGRRGR